MKENMGKAYSTQGVDVKRKGKFVPMLLFFYLSTTQRRRVGE